MKKTLIAALTLLIGLALSVGAAQAEWTRTGTVDLAAGDASITLHTFVTHVDDDVAEGIEDDAARAVAERVAGTDRHTATWTTTDPVVVGDAVMAPPMTFVTIHAREEGDPDAGGARLDLEFGIDPETHELLPDAEVAVEYHPAPYDRRDSYATTEGTLTIESTERVDDATLAVTGTVEGVLAYEGEASAEGAPADGLPIEASFRIDQVVGSGLLSELLGE